MRWFFDFPLFSLLGTFFYFFSSIFFFFPKDFFSVDTRCASISAIRHGLMALDWIYECLKPFKGVWFFGFYLFLKERSKKNVASRM